MKLYLSVVALLLFLSLTGNAQKISDAFNPVIKEIPRINIVQDRDDNYLIFGDNYYYGDEPYGCLIKVDQAGKIISNFQKVFTDNMIESVIALPNGKLLIRGPFSHVNGIPSAQLVQINVDGSVDPNFQADASKSIRDFVVQSTGKIVILTEGSVYQEAHRLNQDGTSDGSFIDQFLGFKYRLLLGENDKLYISNSQTIYRTTPDGAMDNTFTFATDPSKGIDIVARQDDGKLIVSVVETMFTPSFSISYSPKRYNADGSIDNSFTAGSGDQPFVGCLVRKNGKIVITGYATMFDSHPGTAFELNADGTYSSTLLTTDFNGIFWLYEDHNENIFVSGGFRKVNNTDLIQFIAKLKPNSQVDLSFKLPITQGAGSFVPPLGAQSSGKLLVGGGYSFLGVAGDSSKLVRLLPDGSVDASFRAAINNVFVNTSPTSVTAIAVQSDDKLIVGGNNLFNNASTSLGRLLPDGGLDNSFQMGTGLYNSGFAASVQSILIKDSKIYILGGFNAYNGTSCQSLVILDEAGSMIGPQQAGIPPNSYLQDMAIQSDGKIVLMGDFNINADNRRFIRLNTDGSIDESFKLKNILGNLADLEIDRHDNVIVSGSYLDYNTKSILKRFKADGEADLSLDLGTGFEGGSEVLAFFAIPLEDDRLVVGGSFYSYKGVSSPSVILMDNSGSIIPMENHLDAGSASHSVHYKNNILYSIGYITNNFGHYKNGFKIVFPVGQQASNYQGKATSDSSMKLSWEGQFDGADRIIIETSSPDTSNYSVVATVAPNAHGYKLEGLTEVTPYYVRIKGANDAYASFYLTTSDTTDIVPQDALPPTDVTMNSFVANWKYIPGTDSCILQLSDDNFASLVTGYENVVVEGPSLKVSDLEDGKEYQYHVKRFKNKKASDYSNPVTATTVTNITGLEAESLLSVNVYPNPVADQIVVELKESATARIVIHSINGNVLNEYEIHNGSKEIINAQGYPDGVYIMTVASEGKTRKFKLVRSSGK